MGVVWLCLGYRWPVGGVVLIVVLWVVVVAVVVEVGVVVGIVAAWSL